MASDQSPVTLAGVSLGDHRHVCAFFNSADDEYRVMTPFIQEGLTRGDRAVHFVAGDSDDHVRRLRRGGIDVDTAQSQRQLEILRSEDIYQPDGTFNGSRMLDSVQGLLSETPALGFGLTRLWAHAEFICAAGTSALEFIEYETRLNYILPRYADPVVCVYDLAKTSAGVAFDVLRIHPVVIVGDVLQDNPYFVAPDLLLGELEERRHGLRHLTPRVAGGS